MSSTDWRANVTLDQAKSHMRRRVGEIDISVTLHAQEIADEAAAQNVIRYYNGE